MNKRIIIISILILCIIGCFIKMDSTNKNIKEENSNITIEQNIINQTEEEEIIEDSITIEEALPQEPETYTTMYSTVGLNIRQEPNTDSAIVDTVSINTELDTVDNSEEDG